MIGPEAAQAAGEAVRHGGQGSMTWIGLGILIVSNLGIWLDKLVQMSRNRAAKEEAEAREAEAKAKTLGGKGNNGHAQYVVPHSNMLERHETEIRTLMGTTAKFERENREDHQKIFGKLDDLKDLILRNQRPPAGA